MMPDDSLLSAEQLVKHYPVRSGLLSKLLRQEPLYVHAVDEVSFSIRKNETFAVVGESGSGKSTLGLLVLRLVEPTAGKVIFDGQSMEELSEKDITKLRRHMQIVFQDPSSTLDPRKRIIDSVAEPLRASGIKNQPEIIARVTESMHAVGLDKSQMRMLPHQFSGGQRQRISIARAIIVRPKFIVLDEPTSSLDASVQSQILLLLQQLQLDYNLSYMLITHNMSVAKYMSDRIGILYLGKLVEMGDNRAVIEEPLHPYTQLLLSSVLEPSVDTRITAAEDYGETPSSVNPPKGCRFNTRCPYAKESCFTEEPQFRQIKIEHFVACHFAEEIASGMRRN
jgi:oligopeptide/dipeptide ABC transporter ATP-binding protein